MTRIDLHPSLYPNGLQVIEEGKKVSLFPPEELMAALSHFQLTTETLVEKVSIQKLSETEKAPLIQITDSIEETLTDLLKDPSPYTNLDIEIMKKMISCLSKERALRETTEQIHLSEILFQQRRQIDLNNEFLNLKLEISESTKMAERFGYASLITGVIAAGCTIAALATGGVGAALSLALAGSSIANGITSMGKTIFDYQKEKKSGDLFELGSQRDAISDQISDDMESVMDAIKGVMRSWSDLRELLASRLEASKNF